MISRSLKALKPMHLRLRVALRQMADYPPHSIVGLPALSPTMTTGTIGAWIKKPGDKCEPGETIAEIETDKATVAFDGQDEFYIAKHLVTAGTEVIVGEPILITVDSVDDIAAFNNYVVQKSEATPPPTSSSPPSTTTVIPKVEEVKLVPPPKVETVPLSEAAPVVVSPQAVPVKETPPPPSASSSIPSGIYSVRVTKSNVKTPLSKKLSKDQESYIEKYGRVGHRPI